MAQDQLTFRFELGFPFEKRSVRSARKAISLVVNEWGFSDQARREVELCFSEALQNALEHGSPKTGSIDIICQVSKERIKITIEDLGAGRGDLDALRSAFESKSQGVPHLDKERGRGIFLIRRLMDLSKMERIKEGGVRIIMVKNRT